MVQKVFAAGGVVIKKEKGQPRVLLIMDSYGCWTWPKGHLEEGETPEETALREVAEETGQAGTVIVEPLGRQKYSFKFKSGKIDKTVHIFLIKASAREKITVQTSEIREARWFSAEEAVGKIQYRGSRTFLKKGIKIFRRRYCQK
ncbi:MAG: NUDIX hydrolase [Candidatus Omnitrophota bacterium]